LPHGSRFKKNFLLQVIHVKYKPLDKPEVQ
jgi:hypothetical protein